MLANDKGYRNRTESRDRMEMGHGLNACVLVCVCVFRGGRRERGVCVCVFAGEGGRERERGVCVCV